MKSATSIEVRPTTSAVFAGTWIATSRGEIVLAEITRLTVAARCGNVHRSHREVGRRSWSSGMAFRVVERMPLSYGCVPAVMRDDEAATTTGSDHHTRGRQEALRRHAAPKAAASRPRPLRSAQVHATPSCSRSLLTTANALDSLADGRFRCRRGRQPCASRAGTLSVAGDAWSVEAFTGRRYRCRARGLVDDAAGVRWFLKEVFSGRGRNSD